MGTTLNKRRTAADRSSARSLPYGDAAREHSPQNRHYTLTGGPDVPFRLRAGRAARLAEVDAVLPLGAASCARRDMRHRSGSRRCDRRFAVRFGNTVSMVVATIAVSIEDAPSHGALSTQMVHRSGCGGGLSLTS